MGVQIYLLDRREVQLCIADHIVDAGTARTFFKVTELNAEREEEIKRMERLIQQRPAPSFVMVSEVLDIPISDFGETTVRAHRVLGWDADRVSVTDWEWDHLPILGYAARDSVGRLVLHELLNGALRKIGTDRAVERQLIGADGVAIRHGQPVITECRTVLPFIKNYVSAECTLANGTTTDVITLICGTAVPGPAWYIGRRPRDAVEYRSAS